MHEKLTNTGDEEAYTLVRPHFLPEDLLAAYRDMAGEEEREAEAHAWAEGTLTSP